MFLAWSPSRVHFTGVHVQSMKRASEPVHAVTCFHARFPVACYMGDLAGTLDLFRHTCVKVIPICVYFMASNAPYR